MKELSKEEREILFQSLTDGDVDTYIVMGMIENKTRIFIGNQSKEFTIGWLRTIARNLENN